MIALLAVIALLSGCATAVDGTGHKDPLGVPLLGSAGGHFDNEVTRSLVDILDFWKTTYPRIARGATLPPVRGDLYSVDGADIIATHQAPTAVRGNACLKRRLTFIIDNAAYCQLDDSIIWDRARGHLLPVLTAEYGPTLTALVFAHEFGHAVQHRLRIDATGTMRTIDIESQADCAAGAFAAASLAGTTDLHMTASALDRALTGYFQIRDSTPESPSDVTHGNGFDRINALRLGIQHGATYCFSPSYLSDRTYTERGYTDDTDYSANGNQPLAAVLGSKGIVTDLNRFWKSSGTAINKTFTAVRLKEAGHPACGSSQPAAQFGYCPDDNTVYYSSAFARQAYFSITDIVLDKQTAAVRLMHHQPGDYALGFMLAVAWGLAGRHQFYNRSTADGAGLLAAVCYAGAYSENINRQSGDSAHPYVLSPPDMDEATSAALNLVDLDTAFGSRGTTGLQRVVAFVKGYGGGLGSC